MFELDLREVSVWIIFRDFNKIKVVFRFTLFGLSNYAGFQILNLDQSVGDLDLVALRKERSRSCIDVFNYNSKIVILILRKKILVSSKKLLETSKIILVSIVRILF
jgi:hypothetical protein